MPKKNLLNMQRPFKEKVSVGNSHYSPSDGLKEYKLAVPVVSCSEAAREKGIPLRNELKSLILKTSYGYVILHLPGDSKASLRKVKRALQVKQAFLASPEELQDMGLRPGEVSAIKCPIWSMLHLVSSDLLTLDYISTNSGSMEHFYVFSPLVFLDAEKVVFGDFWQGE